MNFHEYQIKASQTACYPNVGNSLFYPALGIAGEGGEVAEKVKKIYRDQNGIITDANRVAITKELGDVLWYMAALCGELGIELEDVAILNIDKVAKRISTNTLNGSGDDREAISGLKHCSCHGGTVPAVYCICKNQTP